MFLRLLVKPMLKLARRSMKHLFAIDAIIIFGLSSCATIPQQSYLVPQEGSTISSDVPWECLRSAQKSEKSRERIYEADRARLQNVDTRRFLWWTSPNEVRPIADGNGRPSMHPSSANENYASRELSDHYVLCLLRSGFSWPTP